MTYLQIRILAAIADDALRADILPFPENGTVFVELTNGHLKISSDGRLSGAAEGDEQAHDAIYARAFVVSDTLRRQAYPHLYEQVPS